jgi:hypothetical protein
MVLDKFCLTWANNVLTRYFKGMKITFEKVSLLYHKLNLLDFINIFEQKAIVTSVLDWLVFLRWNWCLFVRIFLNLFHE